MKGSIIKTEDGREYAVLDKTSHYGETIYLCVEAPTEPGEHPFEGTVRRISISQIESVISAPLDLIESCIEIPQQES